MFTDKLTLAIAEAAKKCMDEELVGNQRKIDANKNGKVDAHDFKILRKEDTVDEGAIDDLRDRQAAAREANSYKASDKKQDPTKRTVQGHQYGGTKQKPETDIEEAMSNPGLESLASKVRAARTGKPSNPALEKIAHEKAKAKYLNKEDVEQIDELSKTTLASYVNKASKDAVSKGRDSLGHDRDARETEYKARIHAAVSGGSQVDATRSADASRDKSFDSMWKAKDRLKNIAKATGKLAKEALEEEKMSDEDMTQREKIVKGMKKNLQGFKSRYGADAEKVMYATATKQAMKEGAVPSTEKTVTVKHKTSGKEMVVTANSAAKYKSLGYHPVKESVEYIDEETLHKYTQELVKSNHPDHKIFKHATTLKGSAYKKYAHQQDTDVRDKLMQYVKEDVESLNEREASPTAGTRKIASYGDHAHTAEVRYNPEYQEYQVHHYKAGKHQGEGPVSYHYDDKADAHSTAKHSVGIKESVVAEEANPTGVKTYHKNKDTGKEHATTNFTAKAAAEHEKELKKAGHTITGRALMFGAKEGPRRNVNEEVEQINEDDSAHKGGSFKMKDGYGNSRYLHLTKGKNVSRFNVEPDHKKSAMSHSSSSFFPGRHVQYMDAVRKTLNTKGHEATAKHLRKITGYDWTVHSLHEEVEQIDEISTETLKSYERKVSDIVGGTGSYGLKYGSASKQRIKNLMKAKYKLADRQASDNGVKEEVELDESVSTRKVTTPHGHEYLNVTDKEHNHKFSFSPLHQHKALALKDGEEDKEMGIKRQGENIQATHAKTGKTSAVPRSKFTDHMTKANEEVEQIDELSKTTLGSYVNNAARSARAQAKLGAEFGAQSDKDYSKGDMTTYKIRQDIKKDFEAGAAKRLRGIKTAVGKLTKEGVEQIDEVTSRTKADMTSPEVIAQKYSMYSNDTLKTLHAKSGDFRAKRELAKRNVKEEAAKAKYWKDNKDSYVVKEESISEEHLVHVDTGAKYDEEPHPRDVEHVRSGIDKHGATFAGNTDKGIVFKFKNAQSAIDFKNHTNKSPHKSVHADLTESVQIDEISKATLGSYVKKAALSQHYDNKNFKSKEANNKDTQSDEEKRKGVKKSSKRTMGVMNAINRLTKEEVEQIDEASIKLFMGKYQVWHKGQKVAAYNSKTDAQDHANSLKEGVEINEATLQAHKVGVTVSDPNHTSVSQRKEKIQKSVIVKATDKGDAQAKAEAYYKKNGYKVHDSFHRSVVPSTSLKFVPEEVTNDDFKAELEDNKAKAAGTKKQPDIAKASVQAVKQESFSSKLTALKESVRSYLKGRDNG